ncbi:MAG: glycosyltransferase [Raineya sp.]
MKILHINTMDYGGAAKACLRLHQGLLLEGVSSKVLFKYKTSQIPETYFFTPPPTDFVEKLKNKVIRISQELKLLPYLSTQEKLEISLRKQRKGLEYFSYPFAPTDITKNPLYKEADIIHLHWVADFLDWKSFFAKNCKPIVWTLHDQNPFLGIEHYAERFLGIDENGKPIPRKYTPQEIAEEKKMISFKKKILEKVDNLIIVAPSKWLMEESQKSEVLGKYPHYHIPYGFPTEIFKPYNKFFCQEILGLPKEKKLILFVADSVDNHRKGFAFLKKALEGIENKEVILCAVGSKASIENKDNLIELGRIQDERLMAMAYSAADVFVIPSLEDNLPNTMIESLLCGTPVVGFPVGGILDVVENGENGYICENIDVSSLQDTIEKSIYYSFCREEIALKAKEKFSLCVQAKNYIELYKKLY